jgi:hypothetical protein
MKARTLLLAVALAAAGAARAQPARTGAEPSALGTGYDGAWSFESTTTSGSCPTLVPVSVVVQGGRVISANSGASSPWGYVESDGTFAAKFTDANGHVSRATGRFAGTSGAGAWSSGSDFCGGSWRAHRGAAVKAAR